MRNFTTEHKVVSYRHPGIRNHIITPEQEILWGKAVKGKYPIHCLIHLKPFIAFKIGDRVESKVGGGIILRFKLYRSKVRVYYGDTWSYLKDIQKTVVLRTRDGKPIYTYQDWWTLSLLDSKITKNLYVEDINLNPVLYFSTQEDAERHIFENTICFSLSDIFALSEGKYKTSTRTSLTIDLGNLIKKAKQSQKIR